MMPLQNLVSHGIILYASWGPAAGKILIPKSKPWISHIFSDPQIRLKHDDSSMFLSINVHFNMKLI